MCAGLLERALYRKTQKCTVCESCNRCAPALAWVGGVPGGRKKQIECAPCAEGVHSRIVVPGQARQREQRLAPAHSQHTLNCESLVCLKASRSVVASRVAACKNANNREMLFDASNLPAIATFTARWTTLALCSSGIHWEITAAANRVHLPLLDTLLARSPPSVCHRRMLIATALPMTQILGGKIYAQAGRVGVLTRTHNAA